MSEPVFRRLRTLRWLNNAAVGTSLAACTAAIFSNIFTGTWASVFTGLPTLLAGVLWMHLLRRPQTLGTTKLRTGWLLSVPIAALNAGVACGLLFGLNERMLGGFFAGLLAGVTLGALFWVPALLLTLLCFGIPVATAQQLAKKGLAGEERGERVVGIVSTLLSLAAAFVATTSLRAHLADLSFTVLLATAGLLTGGVSTAIARLRDQRRRAFVAEAEAGKLPNYRVDLTNEGKVLVRVSAQANYRAAGIEEELCALDATGEATVPRKAEL